MDNVKRLIRDHLKRPDKTKYTRPEGAGNYDNMDDKNIVDQINMKIGTSELEPRVDKEIANKKYVDDSIAAIVTVGATGSFTAGSGETITVSNGIITFITSASFIILLETADAILMENGDRMENG